MKKVLSIFVMVFAAAAVFGGDCHWIWGAGEVDKTQRSVSYFRLNLDITDDVVSAEFYTISDDGSEVYLNGPKINHSFFDQAKKRILIRKYEFKSLLKKGRNVLSVAVVNNAGPGGLIGKGEIRLANGKVIDLATNSQWKAAMKNQPHWNVPAFNDQAWGKAFIIGDASAAPWAAMSDAVNFFGLPGGKK